jgi:hypothetical protein
MRPTVSTIAVALALMLSACASRSEAPVAAVTDDDDAFCRAGGAAAGSPDYVACRKNRDAERDRGAGKAARTQRNLNETMINTPYKP